MPCSDPSIHNSLGLGQPPLATVLMLHTLPDGSTHIDWMTARDSKNAQLLLSFHLGRRLDELSEGRSTEAVRIQDHRPLYLDFEGEVAGNRGKVQRLAWGTITRYHKLPDVHLEIIWNVRERDQLLQRLALTPQNPSQWLVNCISIRRC